MENSELERLRKEVFSLERLLIDLNGEFEAKEPYQKKADDFLGDQIETEVKLLKENARFEALESEMKHDQTNFAQEIVQLETILMDKQRALENMHLPNNDINNYDGAMDY